jgi:hypothetical protein
MSENLIVLPGVKRGGEFRLIVRDLMGRVTQDTGWFPNLLTDQGLINMAAQNAWSSNMNVGSGTTPPAFTDTSLVSWMADVYSSIVDSGGTAGSGSPQPLLTKVRR